MGTNTGIGIGIGIPFRNNALGGDRPYLPPELKARLIGVWDNYGKKNTDADRNIIKNKIHNAGGDLEILNSAYRLNSGFGEYSNDFQEYTYSENVVVKDNTNAIFNSRGKLLVPYSYLTKDIPSFKIKVSGLSNTYHFRYYYRDSNGVQHSVDMAKDGNYELPICYNVQSSSDGTSCGFTNYGSDIVSVEILPEYEGAFVTDGVNDMIISQKTLQEMGVTKDFTIVSMIHQITLRGATAAALTNYIRQPIGHEYVRNHVANIGKTGIYGYVVYDVNHSSAGNSHTINTILGDKNDYSIHIAGNLSQGKFSVQGYINGEDNVVETSRVAHYWTFALLGKATEDDINLIIGYFNLDRTLKADIYCNIEKQGLTNENHAEFNDKLIDYSGNGRDLQLFNIGWKGESGIGRYTEEFKNDYWLVHKDQTGIIKDGNSIKVVGKLSNYYIVYHSRLKATNGFKVKIKGIKTEIVYNYISSDKEQSISFKEDGIYDISASEAVDSTFTLGFYFRYNDINLDWTGLTIEIIPSNKGALCLDGINDFGKVINMPIYKDYTIIIDYIRTKININTESSYDACVLSKSKSQSVGAFMFNLISGNREYISYSFGHKNIVNIDDTIRAIYYQSKYINNGQNIDIESTFVDSDKLWLGTFRDNDSKFLNGAIYFLMFFPYSMNKFLIERQLKKYKAGTLYKDMVEFRPVIKSNIDIKNIVYLDKDSNVVKVGDYISIGSNIKTSITVLDGYKISKVSSTAFNNITIEKSNTDFIYDVIFYGIKKSPQKINLVIEQDSDYVQWNPNIKANVSKYSVTANIRETDGTTLKLVNGQFYSTSITGNLILDIVPPYKDSDEVTNVVIDGKSYTPTKDSSGNYYRLEIPLVFPKEIDITIQEYVKYDDIVQPYPVIFVLQDKESGKELTYGNYVKVGDIIKVKSVIYYNQDLWSIHGYQIGDDSKIYSYNELINKDIVVTKPLSFSCIKKWLLSTAEPLFVYDPAIFTNNAIKTLGYLPDISGQNRHLKLYNFSYEGMSGKDGYPVVFGKNKTWENIRPENDNWKYGLSSTSITIYKALDTSPLLYTIIRESGGTIKPISIPSFKINVKGLQDGESIRYRYFSIDNPSTYSNIIITKNGKHELPASVPLQSDSTILDVYIGFQVILNNNESVKGLIIEILPDYKDSLYFNGITNAASVLNLDHGGKCLVTKINYKFNQESICIYDQRKNTLEENNKKFALLATQLTDIAYGSRLEGNTYINNVLNNYVRSSELENVEHVATLVSSVVEDSNTKAPLFGRANTNQNYAQFAMYRTILLPEVPNAADRAILNKWCGLPTGYLPKPEYYWDVTGKSNSDTATRNTIKNLGTAKPVASTSDEDAYSLENKNVAYEGMSGYNGYPVVFGANKTWETSNTVHYIYDINSTIIHITNVKHAANGLLYSYVKKDGALANIKEIPAFRVTIKGLEENSKLAYRYLATENATKESIVYLGNGIHKLPKSFVPTDALLDLTTNSWIGFAITPMIEGEVVFDCDITIEILPEYENGLVYDGVSDFTDNKNIPIFTDFTAIIKRVDLDAKNDNSTVMFKGNEMYVSGIGNGFILDYCHNSKNYIYSYGKLNQIERDDSKIIYLTPKSYNGNPIIKGENRDNLGLILGKYWKGIIYKIILYSKTISLLEINFLKNLMEKDEIIDINHPIFISNTEDESNASQDT